MEIHPEILDILRRTVDNDLLGDICYSTFADSGKSFFALRYLSSLLDENGEPFWYLRNLPFYSSRFDNEKWQTEWQGQGWTAMGGDGKSLEQKLKEKDFQAAFIQFYGVFFNNRWRVEHRLHFLGNDIPADEALKQEEHRLIEDFIANPEMYFREQRLSPHATEDDHYIQKYGNLPSMIFHQLIDLEESQNEKFSSFVQTAYADPFVKAFRYYRIADSSYTSSFFNWIPRLISSDFRYYLFSITAVTHSNEIHHHFFLTDCFSGIIYEWTRWPILVTHLQENPFESISKQFLSVIREFDYRLLNGSLALDIDHAFWKEHVLPVSEEGVSKYLVPAWKKTGDQWLMPE